MHIVVFLAFLLSVAHVTPIDLIEDDLREELSSESLDELIVGGEDANKGDFPFVVSLRIYSKKDVYRVICAATILTANWTMTAARCCLTARRYRKMIYAGSIYLDKGGKAALVAESISHHFFKLEDRFDICLLRLSEPLVFGEGIQQTTLATLYYPVDLNDIVTVSGWGSTTITGPISDTLQKAYSYRVVLCNGTEPGDNGVICPLSRVSSIWKGDWGGPLLKDDIQIGIASKSHGPAIYKPATYVDVRDHIPWIKEKLGDEASQLKLYKRT